MPSGGAAQLTRGAGKDCRVKKAQWGFQEQGQNFNMSPWCPGSRRRDARMGFIYLTVSFIIYAIHMLHVLDCLCLCHRVWQLQGFSQKGVEQLRSTNWVVGGSIPRSCWPHVKVSIDTARHWDPVVCPVVRPRFWHTLFSGPSWSLTRHPDICSTLCCKKPSTNMILMMSGRETFISLHSALS